MSRRAAGFRVVAPDMRGYNLSDKPEGIRAYRSERFPDASHWVHMDQPERVNGLLTNFLTSI